MQRRFPWRIHETEVHLAAAVIIARGNIKQSTYCYGYRLRLCILAVTYRGNHGDTVAAKFESISLFCAMFNVINAPMIYDSLLNQRSLMDHIFETFNFIYIYKLNVYYIYIV